MIPININFIFIAISKYVQI